MRRLVIGPVLCLLALVPLVVACGDDDGDDGEIETSELRVVHASPDAPPVDIYIAGSSIPVVEDLAYGEVTPYLTVDPGTYEFEVRPAGASPSEAPVFTSDPVTLVRNERVTAIATGYVGSTDPANSFRVIALVEDFTEPAAGTAVVRVVHASPDAPAIAVDVQTDGSFEATGLDRFTASSPGGFEVPAGEAVSIGVWAGEPLMRLTSFTTPELPEGAELFVIVIGNAAELPRQDTGLALLAADQTGELATVRQDPTVFVFHGSPDAPSVDVFAGEAELVDSLGFGSLSGPIQVPPGSYDLTVSVAATGQAVATFTTPTLEAGQRYLAIATGFVAGTPSLQVIYAVDELAIDPDSARVVAIHASPDAPPVDIGVATGTTIETPAPVTGLAFGEQTPVAGIELPPGEFVVGVAPEGSATAIATFDVQFAAGLRAFLVAAGALTPAPGQQPFGLFEIDTSVFPWTVTPL